MLTCIGFKTTESKQTGRQQGEFINVAMTNEIDLPRCAMHSVVSSLVNVPGKPFNWWACARNVTWRSRILVPYRASLHAVHPVKIRHCEAVADGTSKSTVSRGTPLILNIVGFTFSCPQRD